MLLSYFLQDLINLSSEKSFFEFKERKWDFEEELYSQDWVLVLRALNSFFVDYSFQAIDLEGPMELTISRSVFARQFH
jgi:hypothetical protein